MMRPVPRTGRGARAARDAAAAIITMTIIAAPAQAKGCGGGKARSAQASESAIACLLNKERRKAGLGRLTADRRLEAAAVGHARDMRDHDYFDHTSLDGRSFSQRILDAGYMEGREAGPWKVGETLAWGAADLSSPTQLVAALMASPPHREVILDGVYRDIGVGLVRGTPTSDASGATLAVEFGTLTLPAPTPAPPAAEPPAPPEKNPGHGRGRGNGNGRDKHDG